MPHWARLAGFSYEILALLRIAAGHSVPSRPKIGGILVAFFVPGRCSEGAGLLQPNLLAIHLLFLCRRERGVATSTQ
jgi:hypothetical protein